MPHRRLSPLYVRLGVCLLLCALCGLPAMGNAAAVSPTSTPQSTPAAMRPFTDMAKRSVALPAAVKSVYATNPMGVIAVYTLAPDLLAGWCSPLKEQERAFIPQKYRTLPALGGRYGLRGTLSPEKILQVAPDVIVLVSSNQADSPDVRDEADRLQEQLHIPVIVLDGDFMALAASFRMLGEAVGLAPRGETLAAYVDTLLHETAVRAARIPAKERVRVYYAQGPRGLQTDPEQSVHSSVLQLVGGTNVATIPAASTGYGRSAVSLEQVLHWNPDVILVHADGDSTQSVADEIRASPLWQRINAVHQGQVHIIPHGPFNWFDRPPGVNRLAGILWLGNLLYPTVFDYDPQEKIRELYALFYHMELTPEAYAALTHTPGSVP